MLFLSFNRCKHVLFFSLLFFFPPLLSVPFYCFGKWRLLTVLLRSNASNKSNSGPDYWAT